MLATKSDGAAAFARVGPNDGTVESADHLGYPKGLLDANDRPCLVIPVYSNSIDITSRLECFDGANWSRVAEGAATTGPHFGPIIPGAAIRGQIFATASTRRFADNITEYVNYEQFTLP